MTPINLHALGPVLQVVPLALVFSSQMLLTEKSSAAVEAGLSEKKTELFSIHATEPSVIQNNLPNLGWSHFGIND